MNEKDIMDVVTEQKQNPVLWGKTESPLEKYLQYQLWKLHCAILGKDTGLAYFQNELSKMEVRGMKSIALATTILLLVFIGCASPTPPAPVRTTDECRSREFTELFQQRISEENFTGMNQQKRDKRRAQVYMQMCHELINSRP